MTVTVSAPAKINLTLDITGKRADGYHTVDMIMQSLSLYDTVTVTSAREPGIKITCSNEEIPCDEHNTAFKAAELFLRKVQKDEGAAISIHKQIPKEAGLAGGSSDAAAVLLALNKIHGEPLTLDKLCELASLVGTDVPFCLYGGTMHATGTGTQLQTVYSLPDCFIVLVKPPIGVSTKEAYRLCDSRAYGLQPHSEQMLLHLKNGNIHDVARALYNEFEQVLCLEPVAEIKEMLLRFGAGGACMSGSGPTVFGIFTNEQKAYECAHALTKKYREIFVLRPVANGCFINEAE